MTDRRPEEPMPKPGHHRSVLRLLVVVVGLVGIASPVSAHSGTTHAGTPHWLLFAVFLVGMIAMAASIGGTRRGYLSPRSAGVLIGTGAISAIMGAVGLVELQVVERTPPRLVEIYPALSLAIAVVLSVGGLVVGRLKWPRKPQYAILCMVLAAWIAYPSVMPYQGYTHPLGYLIVLSLPVVLVVIIWTDARGALQSLRLARTPKLVGIGAGFLMSIFFAFSAGTMSFNPDQGRNLPTEAFLVPYRVADPLVVWPAIEWYVPSIPFSGYLSIGSLLMMGVLGGLVGLNAAIVTQQWTAGSSFAGKEMAAGSLATSGATACCCCAPAFYGIVSVLFGGVATPVYWSFMISSSPVGSTFFAASVLLLLGSFLRLTG